MRKGITGVLIFIFFILLSVSNINASSDRTLVVDDTDLGVPVTYYFKEEEGKWINYKMEYTEDSHRNIINYYYNSQLTENCKIGDELIIANCTYRNDWDYPVEKSAYIYLKSGSTEYLTYKMIATYFDKSSKTKDAKYWIYYKKSKIVSDYYYYDFYNTKYNNPKSETYKSYFKTTKKKVKLKQITKFKNNGRVASHISTKYYKGSKEYGKKNNVLSATSFYSNGAVKATKYTKYRTNGKKKTYKISYFSKSSKPTKLITYSYNKKAQKKSNKNGNAYKYVTKFKSKMSEKGLYPAKKVIKAKYDGKGKLGKYKKVKATSFNSKYYNYGGFF